MNRYWLYILYTLFDSIYPLIAESLIHVADWCQLNPVFLLARPFVTYNLGSLGPLNRRMHVDVRGFRPECAGRLIGTASI